MKNEEAQIKILAAAVYETRQLLCHLIGSTSEETECEAATANLAYALHNDALAIIENNPQDFKAHEAIARIRKVEEQMGSSFSSVMQGVIDEIET